MQVLLLDCDLKYPNLALVKLSAWHKKHGDTVTLNFPLGDYNRVYASCVFSKNKKKLDSLPFQDMIVGGTGSGNWDCLPDEIEHIMPDYSLYNCNYSLGFTSRGCLRHCRWCLVPQKEGNIKAWASIYEFWDRKHRDIVLLDNNLLASPNWKETLTDLAKEKLRVDFNQGLDIRLVNEENAHYLAKLHFIKQLRFSFDEPAIEPAFRQGMDTLLKAGITAGQIMVYVLIGFDTTSDQDMERLNILREYRCDPFAMVYEEVNGVKAKVKWDVEGNIKEFARWVNLKRFFWRCSYQEFLGFRGWRRNSRRDYEA